jgi:hypothetical protein
MTDGPRAAVPDGCRLERCAAGAAVTAVLLETGKLLIGLYIGKQRLESLVRRAPHARDSHDAARALIDPRTLEQAIRRAD